MEAIVDGGLNVPPSGPYIMCVPAGVLSALPGVPADVVHHTGLRTDHPQVVSLSKTERERERE